ncbi:MAG: transglutaminase-like domain-containing protein [Verrucomicrobiota bacterium]
MTKKQTSRSKILQSAWWAVALVVAFFSQMGFAETPDRFARSFSDFKFVYHEKVQEPEAFLASRSGDCDDFATLAAKVLGESGFVTHLYAVRMKGETHVVCYVPETGSYLDYNERAQPNPLVACDGTLKDIARKVSRSFGRDWLSAYEFSYREKMKWLVNPILFNKSSAGTLLASE